jgi:predicted PurR-regulated permease PerM
MAATDRKRIFKFIVATVFLVAFTVLFAPFYAELLLAAVFAFAMEPMLGRMLQQKHLRWRTSVALILVGMFIVVATPLSIVGYKIYASVVQVSKSGLQNTEIYKKVYILKTELVEFGTRVTSRLGMAEQVDLAGLSEDTLAKVTNTTLAIVTGMVGNIPQILLSIFVFCAALYFFLAEAAVLKQIFARQNLLNPHESERFIEVLQRASHSTVVSSVIIGLLQASIVSVGTLIFNIGDFMVVFVIPVIGAGPVALVLALYKLLLGDYGDAIGLGVVGIIAGTVDNLVRPYLISSNEGDLHPIVSLLAIIGALVIFGMPGLLLGPVIASVAVKIIPTLYAGPTVDAKDLGKKST